MDIDSNKAEPLAVKSESPSWGPAGEIAKYTAVIALMIFSVILVRKKLQHLTWQQVLDGIGTIPMHQILLAVLFTAINFVVLTGYDLIAVRYLKKQLPVRKVMVGAIIGYALSNVLGWMIGGTAIRFRLYASWGFRLIEIIALVSILSVTFWLGMFLLAGFAFVVLPVRLPKEYREMLHFDPHWYGYFFLAVVGCYLLATLFIRKPFTSVIKSLHFLVSLVTAAVGGFGYGFCPRLARVVCASATWHGQLFNRVGQLLAAMIVVVMLTYQVFLACWSGNPRTAGQASRRRKIDGSCRYGGPVGVSSGLLFCPSRAGCAIAGSTGMEACAPKGAELAALQANANPDAASGPAEGSTP